MTHLVSERFDKTACGLFHKNGTQASIGDLLTDRDNIPHTLTGGVAPHKYGSTGRVYVTSEDGETHEYFPSVFGLSWQPVNEFLRRFEAWLREVDKELYSFLSIGYLDLPDGPWIEYFEAELTPREAIEIYSKDVDDMGMADMIPWTVGAGNEK